MMEKKVLFVGGPMAGHRAIAPANAGYYTYQDEPDAPMLLSPDGATINDKTVERTRYVFYNMELGEHLLAIALPEGKTVEFGFMELVNAYCEKHPRINRDDRDNSSTQ